MENKDNEKRTTIILIIIIIILILLLGGCGYNIHLKSEELRVKNQTNPTTSTTSRTTLSTNGTTANSTSSKVLTTGSSSVTTKSTASTSTTTKTTKSTASTSSTSKTTKSTTTTKPPFTVSFNTDGGSTIKPITVKCGSKLTLPSNPTKSGYNFVKWTDSTGKEVKNGAVLACVNITLTANWQKKPDVYTYDAEYDGVSNYTFTVYKNGKVIPNDSAGRVLRSGSTDISSSQNAYFSTHKSKAGNAKTCGTLKLYENSTGNTYTLTATSNCEEFDE